MTPAQEAFLDLLREGMTSRAACRRVGVSDSAPFRWAEQDHNFGSKWQESKLRYRRVVLKDEWVEELIGDLEYQGHIGDETDKEALRTCIVRFFSNKKMLEKRTLQKTYNNSPFSREEQMRIVDRYIALKAEGGDCNVLGDYLRRHRVSRSQIKRWSAKYRGPKALHVGPFQHGMTRQKILNTLVASAEPLGAAFIAEQLGLNYETVQAQVRNLYLEDKLKQVRRGSRVFYALP